MQRWAWNTAPGPGDAARARPARPFESPAGDAAAARFASALTTELIAEPAAFACRDDRRRCELRPVSATCVVRPSPGWPPRRHTGQ
jgi:hypothetical protein